MILKLVYSVCNPTAFSKLLSPNITTFSLIFDKFITGLLVEIWKSRYMFAFTWKQDPENFALLILRILEWLAREVCEFPKK